MNRKKFIEETTKRFKATESGFGKLSHREKVLLGIASDIYEKQVKNLHIAPVSESLPDFTGNDVDGAYFLGVFNSSGIDGLSDELKRIKELGLNPHQFLYLLKTKGNVH